MPGAIRTRRLRNLLALLPCAALAAPGCGFQIERLRPDLVADGVARLTVRNVATLTGQLSADETCGFASPAVQSSFVVDGEVGGRGTVTYTVTGCELDFGDELAITDTNCNDVDTLTRGRVVVDAVRVVEGRITGDPTTPVIPESSEAARMEIHASFQNYLIRRSNADTAIEFIGGDVSFVVKPHLGRSESLGVCSVAGANLTLEEIHLENALVEVDSGDSVFPAEVPSALLSAQLGRWENKENVLGGSVTVWDSTVEVPVEGEFDGLDPDYNSGEYFNSYACTDDLLLPVDYTCPDLTPRFAQGTAQLTIATFANVMRLVDKDTTCGFSSDAVLQNPTLLGEVGEAGGQARYEISEPCALDIPDDFMVAVDCNDKITFAEGRVWVTGTKVLSGIRSGDPLLPIVPTNDSPAVISLAFEVEDLKSFDSVGTNKLHIRSGTMAGTARPRTAIDTTNGACALVTPVVTFENISLDNAEVLLSSEGKSFGLQVASALLNAQNGPLGDKENWLAGTITVDGDAYQIPVDSDPVLDPGYDRDTFYASFACTENMELPERPEDCGFMHVLGDGAARLVVAMAGAIASKVNSNADCGFEAYLVLLAPYIVEGEPGEMGLMSWNIEGCSVGSEDITQHEQNCSGGRTMTGGFASVDATRYVTGERTDMILGLVDAIVPRDREAVTIEVTAAALNEFTVEPWGAGATAPKGTLTVHSGTLAATVKPILGERASEPGTFDVPTPVAVLSDVRLQNANATLESEGKTFHLTLTDVNLSAVNGSWNGQSNTISGSLRVNGQLITLDPQTLDETFSQQSFDATYTCTEDLLEVIPAG